MTALAWQPAWQVLAGFNNQAYDDPTALAINLLSPDDSDFEGTTAGTWTASAGTLTLSTLHPAHGTQSLDWHFTTATTITCQTALYGPVVPGKTYTAVATIFSSGGVSAEKDNSVWSNGTVSTSGTNTCTAVAPAGATSAAVQVQVTGTGFVGDLFIDAVGLWVGSATTWIAPGTLAPAGRWTDLTHYTQKLDTSRGRQHELDRFVAGTGDVTFWNADGRFDSWNTTSPYAGLITPGVPIQIRARVGTRWYPVLTGIADVWDSQWADAVVSQCVLTLSDMFEDFALAPLTQPTPAYPTEVLALSGTPPIEYWRMSDPAGSTTMAMCPSLANTPAIVLTAGGSPSLAQPGAMPVDPDGSVSTNGGSGWFSTSGVGGEGVSNSLGFVRAMWVKFPTTLPTVNQYVWDTDAAGNLVNLQFTTAGQLQFTCGSITLTTSGLNLMDGYWHLIVAQYSGVATTGAALFVDNASAGGSGVAATFSFNNSVFGAKQTVTVQAASNFAGAFDEIILWRQGPAGFGDSTYASGLWTAGMAGFQQATSDAQIAAAATTIGWPTGPRVLDVGNSQIQRPPAQLCGGGNVTAATPGLAYMQQVEVSELGALFMQADGQLRYISRHNRQAAAGGGPVVVFGDAPPGANLFTAADSTFENGTIGTWRISGASIVASTTHALDGTHSLALPFSSPPGQQLTATSGSYPVTAGNIFTAVASSFCTAGASTHTQAAIVWLDATGAILSTTTGTLTALPASTWTQATATGTAPAGAAAAQVAVTTSVVTGANTVWLDECGLLVGAGTTWSVGSTELPFEPIPQIGTDTIDLWNTASVTRQGGLPQVAGGKNKYGFRAYQPPTLLSISDAECLQYAGWIVGSLGTPAPRLRQINVHPVATPATGQVTAAVLALELCQTSQVNRHTLPGGGTGFAQTVELEAIKHQVDFATGDWMAQLSFGPLFKVGGLWDTLGVWDTALWNF
jgi:hypothetical protein